MNKSYLLLGMLLLTLTGCSSDDESGQGLEQGNYSEKYDLLFYDKPPYADKKQGKTTKNEKNEEHFYQMTPQTEVPYMLIVTPIDEAGEAIIEKIAQDESGIFEQFHPMGTINSKEYLVVSKKYFESPHLYVSDNYTMEGMEYRGPVVMVSPTISIKMKEGCEAKDIEAKYKDILVKEPPLEGISHPLWDFYRCRVHNSFELLQLSEEINALPEVEWAEPALYGTVWTCFTYS